MRIAVVLRPPLAPGSALDFLSHASATHELSIVTLPSVDPLARALVHELGSDEEGFVVLARAGAPVSDSQWAKLELDECIRRLEPIEDTGADQAIAEGARYLREGDLDRARQAYALADALLSWDHGPRRAEVLVALAGIEAARGTPGAAAALLDRALAIFPDHDSALRQRIDIARASADAATAAALRRRLLRRVEDREQRAEQLSSIADECLTATIEALEQALELHPRDSRLLERLQAALEAAGRWREAVDAKVALSELIEEPRARARALTAAAGMCARRTGDVTRAVALYEAAIADDPSAPGAFEAIEAVLLKNADFSAVARAYERQIERLSGRGETAAEAELCDRLSRLRADRLSDLQGAIVALDRLIVLRPDDVEARARLAALLEQTGELRLAARCLENAAHWAPTRPATFRDLYRICSSLGDLDRSYCSCAVLVHLGEAELDEQRVYQSFAPETTPRPRAALDAQGWQALRTEDHDEVISRIVHAIAPAAIALRVEQLEAARRLPEPARRDRQDVDKSTGMAVRTVPWACAVLGLEVPAVYARNEDIPGGIAHLALPDPTVMLGKALLAGRSVPELAFAIGRELACQELTARLVTFYPTMAELRALIVAAVAQVLPSSLPSDALALRDVLRSRMSPAQRGELEGAVAELEARDGRLDMNRWIRAVEMAACRAGLVVCGDITAAARMLAVDGRVVGGLRAAERIRNLIPFSVSERCAALRKAIGIEARRATAQPPGC